MTGVTLFFYVISTMMMYFEKMSDEAFGVWLGFVVATWIGVMVSIRGVFEVLALKKE